jgi:hypothetical protein
MDRTGGLPSDYRGMIKSMVIVVPPQTFTSQSTCHTSGRSSVKLAWGGHR